MINSILQVMVHTEFNDNPDRFPYNVNDGADIDVILNVCNQQECYYNHVPSFHPSRGFQPYLLPEPLQMNLNKTELV